MTHHTLLEADFAPCATTDPEVFHDDDHADVAKGLCADCPLTAYCRAQARTNREWGTWGGETSDERAKAGHPPRGWHSRKKEAFRQARSSSARQKRPSASEQTRAAA